MTLIVLGFFGTEAVGRAQNTLNVANFGAIGDANQIVVDTVSNSPVITLEGTNQFSETDVGKIIELFGAGPVTWTGTNNQDIIATITGVSNGTNVTISVTPMATTNNLTATYGTQNSTAFQNCVKACTGTNTTVIIPAGNYLLIDPVQLTSYNGSTSPVAVVLTTGGIHFLGAGMTNTTLTGCGAWKLQGGIVQRGFTFAGLGVVSNDYPVIFDSLTFDGGIRTGWTGNIGYPASTANGNGWDGTHHAYGDIIGTPVNSSKSFLNCHFAHWRGEMIIGTTSYRGGFITVSNCSFDDGNASALNIPTSHDWNACTFSNMNFAEEFYEAYCTNASYFRNCLCTNLFGNDCISLNGATAGHAEPAYNIVNNQFYNGSGWGILTTPAQNVNIISNLFCCTNSAAIGFGCAGYQGSDINSNFMVAFNVFTNTPFIVEVLGNGGNSTYGVCVRSNTAVSYHGNSVAYGYGASTNVVFTHNTCSGFSAGLNSTALSGQWYLDDLSNDFPPWQTSDSVGRTNTLTYAHGMRQQLWVNVTNSAFVIDDAHPAQVPPSASLLITGRGIYPVSLYFSASMSGSPLVLSNAYTAQVVWTNGAWQLTGLLAPLAPATNLHLVSPTNGP